MKLFFIAIIMLALSCQDQLDSKIAIDLNGMEQVNDSDSVAALIYVKADAEMKKNGYDLMKLDKAIKVDDNNYYVVYSLNDPNILGGGGIIVFNKATLEIVGKKLEE